jgi:HxlR-like helix-turn-helix
MENLLSWVHPGFSVFAGESLSPQDAGQLECRARYITRTPLAADSIRRRDEGRFNLLGKTRIKTGAPRHRKTGSMEREVDGLTAKLLNERLRKLVRYDVVWRDAYAEIPPRVEYRLTSFGKKLVKILDGIEKLDT